MDFPYKLSEEFLSKYKDTQPDWGPLGWITYKRTYARKIDGENRTEEWWETCRRVIEGNFNIIQMNPHLPEELKEKDRANFDMSEMEKAYDLMFKMAWLPPGRGLWMSGTKYSVERGGDALNNCWYVQMKPSHGKASYPFHFIFDRAMLGGGVGFDISREFIEQFSEVVNPVKLALTCSSSHPDFHTFEEVFDPDMSNIEGDFKEIFVEDSREGWGEALSAVIDEAFSPSSNGLLRLDFSKVREFGTPIKGFGGTSSGPKPLIDLVREVNIILNRALGRKLTSVEILDIVNLIGKCVVSGNVRRTALIALGDPDDKPFMLSKLPMKKNINLPGTARWTSNNSIVIDNEFKDFSHVALAIKENGEPGIVNRYLAQNYGRISDGYKEGIDRFATGVNPCGEITLWDFEPCNLVDVFPLKCDQLGVPYEDAIYIATRFAYRVTFSHYSWKESQEIVEKNRRIGVSLSGIQDWILHSYGKKAILGFDDNDEPIYNPDLVRTICYMYDLVVASNVEIADQLGTNPSIKVTTVKPSGTVTILPGLSPGMHWNYFAYGIRRVRFNVLDPLLPIIRECGFHIEDDMFAPNTVVVEFPVKSLAADHPDFQSAGDVPLKEQFAMQALLASYWADNAVSATLTFKKEEEAEIEGLLSQYSNRLKSTTLLPYSDHGYKQAPYEPVSKEKYEEMVAKIKFWPHEAYNLLQDEEFSIEGVDECVGGFCPIK